ncbi:hypothetical protein T265_11938 [Opisthorchis viverrini]|uniref:Uncharacterized protein n=1 Tax=Opisthorchis viverrini TaxID=6198 RepID=A0A074ZVM7_OPIVI|nr:hypothetical protein T265_11938 [Opisthorchis viverrini]KER19209.1 hypothetical protein T265_11938 [Opisthorchis viverrini]
MCPPEEARKVKQLPDSTSSQLSAICHHHGLNLSPSTSLNTVQIRLRKGSPHQILELYTNTITSRAPKGTSAVTTCNPCSSNLAWEDSLITDTQALLRK